MTQDEKHPQKQIALGVKKRKPACKLCGTHRGVIYKYGLGVCRRCFKDYAEKFGFSKFD